ncbi:MAG: UPF0175 family protein [Bacteroidota bacterium]
MSLPAGIDLHIPPSVVEALRVPEQEAAQTMHRELALALYQQGLLSLGKARELAELDKAAFSQLLGTRGIERHYGAEEAAEDLSYARAASAER